MTSSSLKGQAWLLGRYLADGYIYDIPRKGRKNSYWHNVIFCIGSDKTDDFRNHLAGYHANESNTSNKNGSVVKFNIYDKQLVELCKAFGRGALNKEVAPWVFNLSVEERKQFIDGYVSGDGSRSNNPYQSVATVSKKLALSFSKLVENTLGVSASIFITDVPKTKLFQEKRLIHQHTLYTVRYRKAKSKTQHSKIIDGDFWKPISFVKKHELDSSVNVYNLEVENNHTYNANGIIVHNCQDVSIAGKMKGIRNGTRSGLFYTVTKLIRETPKESKPKWLLIENVKNLLSIDKGQGFLSVLSELDKIGYDAEWNVFDSASFVPQHRERVFLIGHLRGAGTRKVFHQDGESAATNKTIGTIKQIGNIANSKSFGGNPQVGRVYGTNGIGSTITASNYKHPLKIAIKEATKKGYAEATIGDSINLEQPNSKTRRGRVGKGIANTLTTSCNQATLDVEKGKIRIRKLTPRECWRLQGFPDESFNRAEKVNSNSQLYKQAGNSVTVPVIKFIGDLIMESID